MGKLKVMLTLLLCSFVMLFAAQSELLAGARPVGTPFYLNLFPSAGGPKLGGTGGTTWTNWEWGGDNDLSTVIERPFGCDTLQLFPCPEGVSEDCCGYSATLNALRPGLFSPEDNIGGIDSDPLTVEEVFTPIGSYPGLCPGPPQEYTLFVRNIQGNDLYSFSTRALPDLFECVAPDSEPLEEAALNDCEAKKWIAQQSISGTIPLCIDDQDPLLESFFEQFHEKVVLRSINCCGGIESPQWCVENGSCTEGSVCSDPCEWEFVMKSVKDGVQVFSGEPKFWMVDYEGTYRSVP